ncbi:hypothetical protein [Micromonospora sp. CPCC 205556]|uniref:hypothetical protein n=1 Tax=Micromonospora sp. CPCC 205556 TaxID=3122398 RepID=UPI002FEEACA2
MFRETPNRRQIASNRSFVGLTNGHPVRLIYDDVEVHPDPRRARPAGIGTTPAGAPTRSA